MKPTIFFIVSSLLSQFVVGDTVTGEVGARMTRGKSGKGVKSGKGDKGGKVRKGDSPTPTKITLNILNEAFKQPFSPFFVMIHNSDADPLYVRGQEASDALATLAENGDSTDLVSYYDGADGVYFAGTKGGLTLGGQTLSFMVEVTDEFPLVTIASMAVNTNDCFVALNGVPLLPGMVLDTPGLDAGSEVNNENCSSIPGPACDPDSGNVADGEGEGFVHIHRGVRGDTNLTLDFDW
eukprot:CAMPEP_0196133740 /NCGR_PEP_ID=MMETSP0910-20130528/2835_1 /TAXON_ID=49265 /ORGANISM="Thalassiosira rotula, Strain GSO102" /LENGTH=236 /DNA_ID=CAMNT_0041393491 /DNA_START=98 /DNA_END=805 /DNA_ORIENTATION=-